MIGHTTERERTKMTLIQLLMQYNAHIEKFGRDLETGRTTDLERNIIKLMIELDLV